VTSPFPELRTLALIEGAEAVATNVENAVLFEIGAIVGTHDVPEEAFSLNLQCDIDLGDSIFANSIEKVMNALCDGFRAITSRLFEISTNFAFAIEDFIKNLLDNVIATMQTIVSTVTTVISNAVVSMVDQMKVAVEAIVQTLSNIVGAITDQVRRIVESLKDIVGAIFDKIGDVVTAIVNKLGDAVSAVVNKVGQVLVSLKDGIAAILGSIVDAVWFVINKIGDGIGKLIDTVIGTAEAGLGRVRQVIEDIPTALRELASEAQEFIGDKIGNPLANMGNLFIEQVEGFFTRLIDDADVAPDKIIREFLTGVGIPADQVERLASSATRAMPNTPGFLAAAMAFLIPLLIAPIVNTIFSPFLEEIRQEAAQIATPTLIPPADSIDAFIRGFMTEDRFRKELGESGYSNERMDILVASSRRLIDVGEIFRWWLRDFITEDQLDELLRFHKIDSDDRVRLKQAVFFIPPVQDLIRMAVREVFSPSIRDRFKLDEDFPPEFQETAKQQGVSEEWAKNYWAAHWVLPSVTQGFAMLHRKVISAEELDLLLRAQDVMPFWRDKITQVAFNPLTRVDLRRMHKLGLLDSEQLQLRYEDLGFNAENATMMVQFTEAFNEEEPPEVARELEGLTRGTILGMFDDGVLTEGETDVALTDLGISEAAVGLFIAQRKLERERRTRTGLIENIVRLVGGGHISLDAGLDGLAGLGLTATEIAIATQRILNKRKSRDRLPTPVQLNKMLALDIIDAEQWDTAMVGLNFSDESIARISKLTATGFTEEA